MKHLRLTNNGGWCCGALHLSGFGYDGDQLDRTYVKELRADIQEVVEANEVEEEDKTIYKMIEDSYKRANVSRIFGNMDFPEQEGSYLIEAILTDEQTFYHRLVKEVGFEKVTDWINPNTGVECTLYIYKGKNK